ncbi:MAG: hypothetical protein AB8H86_33515 [Polyangiales bacterium]
MGRPEGSGEEGVVPGLEDVAQIVSGERHSCALKNDGSVWCSACWRTLRMVSSESSSGHSRRRVVVCAARRGVPAARANVSARAISRRAHRFPWSARAIFARSEASSRRTSRRRSLGQCAQTSKARTSGHA